MQQEQQVVIEKAPNTDALDAYLSQIVQTVKGAVDQAMRHVDDDPKGVEQTIGDTSEMIMHVMEGNVKEWVQ